MKKTIFLVIRKPHIFRKLTLISRWRSSINHLLQMQMSLVIENLLIKSTMLQMITINLSIEVEVLRKEITFNLIKILKVKKRWLIILECRQNMGLFINQYLHSLMRWWLIKMLNKYTWMGLNNQNSIDYKIWIIISASMNCQNTIHNSLKSILENLKLIYRIKMDHNQFLIYKVSNLKIICLQIKEDYSFHQKPSLK